MGYMENSYSNSNNGGSVNSQDSLYQMKMSAAAGNPGNLISQHHQYVERQPSYGYDPLTHGGYGTVDDYATYPHLATTPSQQMIAEDYHNQMMMGQQTPSRQDYCTDPYAAVHKPNKKRLDPHMGKCQAQKAPTEKLLQFALFSLAESPYHDVSGLPDPYMEQMQLSEDQIDHPKPPQQQHMSLGYDETLESGYSTPNSRNRRVIREIIV
jgi:echinoid